MISAVQKVSCALAERYVNPLFEVFDGGDFILSSYRDIEEPFAHAQIFFAEPEKVEEAKTALKSALEVLHSADSSFAVPEIEISELPDEDWRFSYRRHFKTEKIGRRIVVHPPWEPMPSEGVVITLDPGLSFGTGKHETTRACLEYIDELSGAPQTMIDMGCGSGILSIAAALLGYTDVCGFDVDPDAVKASRENAAINNAKVEYFVHALGGASADENGDAVDASREGARTPGEYDLVVANILGPLLIRYCGEIAPCARKHLVVSGILNELYPEVVEAFRAHGFSEVSRKTIGEWTTGLLERAKL